MYYRITKVLDKEYIDEIMDEWFIDISLKESRKFYQDLLKERVGNHINIIRTKFILAKSSVEFIIQSHKGVPNKELFDEVVPI